MLSSVPGEHIWGHGGPAQHQRAFLPQRRLSRNDLQVSDTERRANRRAGVISFQSYQFRDRGSGLDKAWRTLIGCQLEKTLRFFLVLVQ